MKRFSHKKTHVSGMELQVRYNRLRDKEESGMLDPASKAELDELRAQITSQVS